MRDIYSTKKLLRHYFIYVTRSKRNDNDFFDLIGVKEAAPQS